MLIKTILIYIIIKIRC